MVETMEPTEIVLARIRRSPDSKTYAEWSKLTELPLSTLWHHQHGRQSRKVAAAKQQYLTPSEEKTLVDYMLDAAKRGHPTPVKSVGHLAWTIARRRSSTFELLTDNGLIRTLGKN
jgi:hypothetical protein